MTFFLKESYSARTVLGMPTQWELMLTDTGQQQQWLRVLHPALLYCMAQHDRGGNLAILT